MRHGQHNRLVILATIVAALVKICIASVTLGTNDVVAFYQFANVIRDHGLVWIYTHTSLFNHPPLVGYYLASILWLDANFFHTQGAAFPLLLRLPGILGDLCTVIALLSVGQCFSLALPNWLVLLFALNPVSLMISGFHGNTDGLLTMFFFFAVISLLADRAVLAGLFLALACQVKVIPLLFLPLLLLRSYSQRTFYRFGIAFSGTWILIAAEPLIRAPHALISNVLSYGGFWGAWGFTCLLRLTTLPQFSRVSYLRLSDEQIVIATVLKAIIIVAALLIGWKRRSASPREVLQGIAFLWLVFFVFSPAVAPQYLIWGMPFLLLLGPTYYPLLLTSSSIYLFAFYTITSGSLAWYYAHAKQSLSGVLALWALLPWSVFVLVLVRQWLRRDLSLRRESGIDANTTTRKSRN